MTVHLTPTQKTIFRLVKQEGPHDVQSFLDMLEAIKEVSGDNVWAYAIQKVIREKGSIDQLIAGLASQAKDDVMVMADAIGIDLTVSILRTTLND